jgi:hypothetical protein
MKLGSYEHKKLFCRMLIDTHTTDSPKQFPWPKLEDHSLARLQSISPWSELLFQQQEGSRILSAYAQTTRDPLMKEAIALLSDEQNRHTELLTSMMKCYGLSTATPSGRQQQNNPEAAFINFGFKNDLDSFLEFGLFGVVQQAHYLPESLLDRLNTVLDEKARHVVFFINWWAYWNLKLKHKKAWNEPRELGALWARRGALLKLLTACDQEDFDEGSSALLGADRLLGELTKDQFLNICCLAQGQRMQPFDQSLLQPQFPTLAAHFMQRVLKFWPQRVGG